MSNQKTSAVELFRAGFAIFPLLPDAKIPPKCWHWSANAPDCAECGHQAGTAMLMNSQEEVEDWWTQYPDDNIGVNCKESCLLAIDLDFPQPHDLQLGQPAHQQRPVIPHLGGVPGGGDTIA